MIKACLFDLDGTLIDSESFYVLRTYEFVLNYNKSITIEECNPIIGLTMPQTHEYVANLCNSDVESTAQKYLDYISEHAFKFKDILFNDVESTFKKLKEKDILIGICSMSRHEYVEKCVIDCNLEKYVDYYIGGDKCKHNKPNPEIYLTALDVLQIDKNNVIVVEDATTGILAAKNASLLTVARDDSKFNLDQSKADYIIQDLNELIKIIENEQLYKD